MDGGTAAHAVLDAKQAPERLPDGFEAVRCPDGGEADRQLRRAHGFEGDPVSLACQAGPGDDLAWDGRELNALDSGSPIGLYTIDRTTGAASRVGSLPDEITDRLRTTWPPAASTA